MWLRHSVLWIGVATLLMAGSVIAQQATFQDPLDAPAAMSNQAKSSLITAVTLAGNRIVAVGPRGHVLLSDDGGATWQQSAVPVSTDLVAVHFPTARQGWAVGHDCVVIHTEDSGKTWTRQLDGRLALPILMARYEKEAAGDSRGAAVLKNIKVTVNQSANKKVFPLPLLDVWFQDERVGYVVGAFNLIFRTSDGGKTWEPWQDRVENPKEYNLHSVRGKDDEIFIAGERGLILKLDRSTQRFRALPIPYGGSFFGLLAERDLLLAYGIRGSAFLSRDGGKSFRKLAVNTTQSFVGGAVLKNGRIVLVTQAGMAFASGDGGTVFASVALPRVAGVQGATAIGPGAIVLATGQGVNRVDLQ